MKRIIFSLAFLLFAQFGLAQNFMLGAKAGLNYSRLNMSSIGFNTGSLFTTFQENTKYSAGFVVGGFARFKMSSFYIQPELVFALKGGTFDRIKAGGITGGIVETKSIDVQMYGVDVPVMFGYQISKFRVNAGPVASFNFSSMTDLKDAIQDYSTAPADAPKTAIIGYQVGIGVDFSQFSLDLRYEGNFSALSSANINKVAGSNFNFDQKTSLFQFTVGYNFL
jgi:hypothetical protein